MSIGIEENVLGLEVAVDDVEGMEVIEGKRDFSRIELGHWVGEALQIRISARRREGQSMTYVGSPEKCEELSSRHKVHDHIQVPAILK